MATDIPTKEPLTIRAGDTIEWIKNIDDYKASDGGTLKYARARTGYLRFVHPNAALPEMVIRERGISQVNPIDQIDGPGRLPQLLLVHLADGLAGHGD